MSPLYSPIVQLIHDLVVHSLAEEEVMYPAFKHMMGTRCRDHALSEHKTLKNLLMDLDSMTIDSPGFKVRMYSISKNQPQHLMPPMYKQSCQDRMETLSGLDDVMSMPVQLHLASRATSDPHMLFSI